MLVNKRFSAPCYRPQTLASNLAKSPASPIVQGKVPLSTTATVKVVTRRRQRRGFAPTIGCEPHTRSERSQRQPCFMDTTRPRI